MQFDNVTLVRDLWPLLYVAGGFALGYVIEHFVIGNIVRVLAKKGATGVAEALRSTRGAIIIWLTVLGGSIALPMYPATANVVGFFRDVMKVVSIAAGAMVLARIGASFIAGFGPKTADGAPVNSLFVTLTRATVYVCGALIAVNSLGISTTPLLTALGVGGLAVSLAARDTLANLFGGLQISASRQIRLGDYIKLENGGEGYVTDITWRNTTIREIANNLIVVPNEKLASAIYTNYALPDGELTVPVPILTPYDNDLEVFEKITLQTAVETLASFEAAPKDFEPYLRYTELSDENIKLNVVLRASSYADQFALRSELIRRLQISYRAAGLRVPYPARTALALTDGPNAAPASTGSAPRSKSSLKT